MKIDKIELLFVIICAYLGLSKDEFIAFFFLFLMFSIAYALFKGIYGVISDLLRCK